MAALFCLTTAATADENDNFPQHEYSSWAILCVTVHRIPSRDARRKTELVVKSTSVIHSQHLAVIFGKCLWHWRYNILLFIFNSCHRSCNAIFRKKCTVIDPTGWQKLLLTDLVSSKACLCLISNLCRHAVILCQSCGTLQGSGCVQWMIRGVWARDHQQWWGSTQMHDVMYRVNTF